MTSFTPEDFDLAFELGFTLLKDKMNTEIKGQMKHVIEAMKCDCPEGVLQSASFFNTSFKALQPRCNRCLKLEQFEEED